MDRAWLPKGVADFECRTVASALAAQQRVHERSSASTIELMSVACVGFAAVCLLACFMGGHGFRYNDPPWRQMKRASTSHVSRRRAFAKDQDDEERVGSSADCSPQTRSSGAWRPHFPRFAA
mmetsp:Transcript_48301/g.124654  ORF Transcript_48301/g.124654 Transcript_48301/m.124654 type:complete len:122 (+) Transcript_48301:75-440(+)